MIYLKGVLIGFGTALLGCLVAPVALLVWAVWKSPGGGTTVSFSPMGLTQHLADSLDFWAFIIALLIVGFVPSVVFSKK